MNSDDLDFLYQEYCPESVTAEDKEDLNYVPNSLATPDIPVSLRHWLQTHRPNPEAMERKKFEERRPAMGLSLSTIGDVNAHLQLPGLKPVQKRHIFDLLRGAMLSSLIPCSDCSTVEQLLSILREEIVSGVPAPVPDWYVYSTVTMGPRRIGYYYCCKPGCFLTETTEIQFQKCGQCGLAVYCSRDCQTEDWKIRHKKVCKEAKKRKEQTKSVGSMLQKLSDMSLTGQGLPGNSLQEMLANAANNPAVQQRRNELNAEKKRPKKGTPVAYNG